MMGWRHRQADLGCGMQAQGHGHRFGLHRLGHWQQGQADLRHAGQPVMRPAPAEAQRGVCAGDSLGGAWRGLKLRDRAK